MFLSLAEMAARTGLSLRRSRYVLYHGLVPGLPTHGRGRGFARAFEPAQARRIAIATALLQVGLDPEHVRSCLRFADATHPQARSGAGAAMRVHRLEIADNRYARLITGAASRPWMSLRQNDDLPSAGYRPLTIRSLDIEYLDHLLWQ